MLLVGEIRERNTHTHTHTHTHIDHEEMQIITGRCLNQCFQVNRNENERKKQMKWMQKRNFAEINRMERSLDTVMSVNEWAK